MFQSLNLHHNQIVAWVLNHHSISFLGNSCQDGLDAGFLPTSSHNCRHVWLIIFIVMLPFSTSLSPLILNPFNSIVSNDRFKVFYRGTYVNGIEQFQNIFYAEDISGSNRFAPPVPYMP